MSKFQIGLTVFVVILAFVVVLTFIFLSFRPTQPSPDSSIVPSSSPVQRAVDEESLELHPQSGVYQTISSSAAEMINRDHLIGLFIKKLPHQEESFSLIYDIDTNSFVAEISAGRRTQANRELDQFLQENGIMDRDWLYNFTIKQQTY